MLAIALAPMHAQSPGTVKELAGYRLTTAVFQRFVPASRGIAAAVTADPRLAADPPFTREVAVSGDAAEVGTAGSTAEALELLDSADGASPHVIVADIGLPGETGFDLIRRVRKRGGERIPAVAVTAYASPENSQEAIAAGFDLFCAKPIAPEAVIGAVVDALRLGAARTPARSPRTSALSGTRARRRKP